MNYYLLKMRDYRAPTTKIFLKVLVIGREFSFVVLWIRQETLC